MDHKLRFTILTQTSHFETNSHLKTIQLTLKYYKQLIYIIKNRRTVSARFLISAGSMSLNEIQHNSSTGDNPEPEKHRVLIVDDEPAICFAYGKLLESERFGFDICENIEAAVDHLKQNEYFAVISDVRFAGSGNEEGVYFVTVVRKEQPHAKVILVTGYGSDELKKTADELGASHYFEKPVNPSLILTLLRSLHMVADEQAENDYFNSMKLAEDNVF